MSWFKKDVLETLLADQNTRLTEQNRWLQSQVESLQAKILEMKQQGFAHEPTHIQQMPSQSLPDVVDSALLNRARPGSALYGELAEWAQTMLHAEVDPEHVADKILNGGTFDA
jgi:hypothetical protein